jgi:hypothetical protein
MQYPLRRGLVLTAIAGTCLYAIAPAALAQPTTQSPEAIALEATGPITIGPLADATEPTNTTESVAGVDLGLLGVNLFQVGSSTTANVLTSSVTLNSATSAVDELSTPLLNILPITGGVVTGGVVTQDAIQTTCSVDAAGDFTTTTNVANLDILGDDIGTQTFTSQDNVLGSALTLPLGITATVTINKITANDPATGEDTVNGLVISLSDALVPGFTGLNIYLASATCGPYNASGGTPVASGKGLGIGLGLLGLAGAGFATVYARRRRMAVI